ncbi:MAG: Ppx/GppA family phosphatase [Rhizobiales bacterium]|nr:Ppx/GppA family phosphatase [Hyphomicrobiales bacterium]
MPDETRAETPPKEPTRTGGRGRRGARRRQRRKSDLAQPESRADNSKKQKPVAPQTEATTRPDEDTLYAALDLGTNNCRLLIARRNGDSFRVVDAYSRIVRLGEGLALTGELSQAAMDRAVEALLICATKLERRGATRVRTIATAACRTARNGALFIERVKNETGLELEIVTTQEEARLALAGCAPLLDRSCASALVFDIGGGSTELIWVGMGQGGGQRRKRPQVQDWISLPMGVVTLAERHGGQHVPGEIYENMVGEVTEALAPFMQRLVEADPDMASGFHLLGTSGTVTTIAGVHLGLARYDRTRVDGLWISPDEVQEVTRGLLELDFAGRAAHPCVGEERADLVLAGCAIFEAIARAWPAERLRVADRGLREGILLSMMQADTLRGRRRRRRRRRKARAQTGANGPASNMAPEAKE